MQLTHRQSRCRKFWHSLLIPGCRTGERSRSRPTKHEERFWQRKVSPLGLCTFSTCSTFGLGLCMSMCTVFMWFTGGSAHFQLINVNFWCKLFSFRHKKHCYRHYWRTLRKILYICLWFHNIILSPSATPFTHFTWMAVTSSDSIFLSKNHWDSLCIHGVLSIDKITGLMMSKVAQQYLGEGLC